MDFPDPGSLPCRSLRGPPQSKGRPYCLTDIGGGKTEGSSGTCTSGADTGGAHPARPATATDRPPVDLAGRAEWRAWGVARCSNNPELCLGGQESAMVAGGPEGDAKKEKKNEPSGQGSQRSGGGHGGGGSGESGEDRALPTPLLRFLMQPGREQVGVWHSVVWRYMSPWCLKVAHVHCSLMPGVLRGTLGADGHPRHQHALQRHMPHVHGAGGLCGSATQQPDQKATSSGIYIFGGERVLGLFWMGSASVPF